MGSTVKLSVNCPPTRREFSSRRTENVYCSPSLSFRAENERPFWWTMSRRTRPCSFCKKGDVDFTATAEEFLFGFRINCDAKPQRALDQLDRQVLVFPVDGQPPAEASRVALESSRVEGDRSANRSC